jgi:DNA-binding NtrC family response regulator
MNLHDPTHSAPATRTPPPPPAEARRLLVVTTAFQRMSRVVETLLDAGHRVEVTAPDASALRADPSPDAAVVDLEDAAAFDAIATLRARDPALRVVAVAPSMSVGTAQRLLRAGARDLLVGEVSPMEVLDAARVALARDEATAVAPGRCVCGTEGVVSIEILERRALEQAIVACAQNLTEVARRLGIGRTTLYRRLQYFGIRVR